MPVKCKYWLSSEGLIFNIPLDQKTTASEERAFAHNPGSSRTALILASLSGPKSQACSLLFDASSNFSANGLGEMVQSRHDFGQQSHHHFLPLSVRFGIGLGRESISSGVNLLKRNTAQLNKQLVVKQAEALKGRRVVLEEDERGRIEGSVDRNEVAVAGESVEDLLLAGAGNGADRGCCCAATDGIVTVERGSGGLVLRVCLYNLWSQNLRSRLIFECTDGSGRAALSGGPLGQVAKGSALSRNGGWDACPAGKETQGWWWHDVLSRDRLRDRGGDGNVLLGLSVSLARNLFALGLFNDLWSGKTALQIGLSLVVVLGGRARLLVVFRHFEKGLDGKTLEVIELRL